MTMTSHAGTLSHRQTFLTFTGPNFMSISLLVLELSQFLFIGDWPEIRKSEIPRSDFCPISGDCGKLRTSNLAWMSLMKCYWMLQNARVRYFILPTPRLGLNSKSHTNIVPHVFPLIFWSRSIAIRYTSYQF